MVSAVQNDNRSCRQLLRHRCYSRCSRGRGSGRRQAKPCSYCCRAPQSRPGSRPELSRPTCSPASSVSVRPAKSRRPPGNTLPSAVSWRMGSPIDPDYRFAPDRAPISPVRPANRVSKVWACRFSDWVMMRIEEFHSSGTEVKHETSITQFYAPLPSRDQGPQLHRRRELPAFQARLDALALADIRFHPLRCTRFGR